MPHGATILVRMNMVSIFHGLQRLPVQYQDLDSAQALMTVRDPKSGIPEWNCNIVRREYHLTLCPRHVNTLLSLTHVSGSQ